MTMFPSQTLFKHQQQEKQQQQQDKEEQEQERGGLFYGGWGLMSRLEGYEYCTATVVSEANNCLLGSDLAMAEDESTTNSLNEEAAATSSSKDVQEDKDEGWLQLSIGGHTTATTTTTSHESSKNEHHHHHNQEMDVDPAVRRKRLVELDLLPTAGSSSHSSHLARPLNAAPPSPVFQVPPPRPSFSTSFFFQQVAVGSTTSSSMYHHHHHPYYQWTFRPTIIPSSSTSPSSSSYSSSSSSSSTSSSSTSLMPFGTSYFSRPFQLHTGVDVAGPSSSEFRVIDPPRRPHSGIWFMLQASLNQAKEPFLPQVPKSFLRIKDGRMTVGLLMKYLVNKLKLDSESEIEITCRGQQLLPFVTLQHVRDNIWSARDAVTLLPESSTTDHVMVLHYGRSA